MSAFTKLLPSITYGWAITILIISVIPAEDLPSLNIWEPDKVMHAAVYALLTFLAWRMRQQRRGNLRRLINVIYSAVMCIAYGFCMEVIQQILPTRKFDLYDALANAIGCILMVVLVVVFSGRDLQIQS